VARRWAVFGTVLAGLLASRLCHLDILWTDADYHLAGALQMLHGSVPYRDFWFDKPPLTALFYMLIGARAGAPLALACALYVFLACVLAYQVAVRMWGEREGLLAAALLGFYLIFYLPAAVIPLAVDQAMLVPHLAALACLLAGFPAAAGVAAGIAFFFNVKAVFVLAVCLLWRPARWARIMGGFLAVVAVAAGTLALAGALQGYGEQVWKWGVAYARATPAPRPYHNGLVRTANWLGFHAAIVVGTILFFARERSGWRRELWIWLVISAAAVCVGLRFAPRYYLQWLPAMALAGARGFFAVPQSWRRPAAALAGLLLLVPAVRFGPRYFMLAGDLAARRPHQWADIALDQDNQTAAWIVNQHARPGNTLLVWGYRPGVYVYTRLRAGSRFLDAQPLTGIPAFTPSAPVIPEWARANRAELARSMPTFLVDSSGPADPGPGIERFPELRPWLAHYCLIGHTPLSAIYQRGPLPDAAGVLAHHRLAGGAGESLLKLGHVGDHAVDPVLAR
jgi:hypothetical protein